MRDIAPVLWVAWQTRLEQERVERARRRILREIILGAEQRVAHRDLQLVREMYRRPRKVIHKRQAKLDEARQGLARLQAELDELEKNALVLLWHPHSTRRPL